jgi:hypothetical protein
MLDSEAVFRARLHNAGVSSVHVAGIVGAGCTTLAKLGFCCSAQPGSGDEAPFTNFVVRALSLTSISDISAGELASIRRVWYEAHTVAIAEIRSRLETTDDSAPKKLPVPERSSRLSAQQKKLAGIVISGPLEPSHALIDFVFAMKESEVLKYVDPVKCTSRDQELVGVKKEQGVKVASSGQIVLQEKDQDLATDISTEFRLRNALQRRSLALDQSELLNYDESEAYHNYMFSLLTMDVPSHCQPIDSVQILNADRILWQRMA